MKSTIVFLLRFLILFMFLSVSSGQNIWRYTIQDKIKIRDIPEIYTSLDSLIIKENGITENIVNKIRESFWLVGKIEPSNSNDVLEIDFSFFGSTIVYYGNEIIYREGFKNDSSDVFKPEIAKNRKILISPDKNDAKFIAIYYNIKNIDKHSKFLRFKNIWDYFSIKVANINAKVEKPLQGLDTGIFSFYAFLSFSLIFLIFYFFNRRKSFLFFSFYLFGSFIFFLAAFYPDSFIFFDNDFSNKTALAGLLLSSVMMLLFYQFVINESFSKSVWIYVSATSAAFIVNLVYPQFEYSPHFIILVFAGICIIASKNSYVIYSQNYNGSKFIIISGVVFTINWILILANFANQLFFGDAIFIIVNVSQILTLINVAAIALYLAKMFSERSRLLESKIEDLQNQNEKAIQKEKEYKKKEIAQRLLEAENTRKENEVEEARQIQLSLIPNTFPEMPNIDIDAYMKTSNEVGGNYFDFFLDEEEKALTFIIGDSNGRGIKSVIMTAATKSLFLTNGSNEELGNLISEFDYTLSKLGSGILTMALTIGRIKGNILEIISAGMPAILLYRSKTSEIEQILFRTSPIGSISYNEFETKHFIFNKDDIILVMTEGFPKLENPQGEKLNYSRIIEIMKGVVNKPVKEIADELTNSIRVWSDSKVPSDDVSFLLFKFK
ncbi:MAG: SpoIIE family protein phosphatase [Ignavibacteria bacterium]|nr:SpoIIE family protein phosphatase [Ignavibacteria bacterium]